VEIGKEPSQKYQNMWPKGNYKFKEAMMEFYEKCNYN
jgi:hypothetical protein